MTALRKNSDGRQMNPPRLNEEQNYRRMVKKKKRLLDIGPHFQVSFHPVVPVAQFASARLARVNGNC